MCIAGNRRCLCIVGSRRCLCIAGSRRCLCIVGSRSRILSIVVCRCLLLRVVRIISDDIDGGYDHGENLSFTLRGSDIEFVQDGTGIRAGILRVQTVQRICRHIEPAIITRADIRHTGQQLIEEMFNIVLHQIL